MFKPKLGTGLSFLARLTGRMPPDCHVWIVPDDVPAFVRFDGPLVHAGAVLADRADEPSLARRAGVAGPRPIDTPPMPRAKK